MKPSISKKMTLILIIFATVLTAVAIYISSTVIVGMNESHFKSHADEQARVVCQAIDPVAFESFANKVRAIYDEVDDHVTSDDWGSDAFNAYIAHYYGLEEDPDYQKVLKELRSVQDILNVECVYTTILDAEDAKLIYVVDADESEDVCPIGCIDRVLDENRAILDDIEVGLPAYASDIADYGWLVSAATVIHAEDGRPIGLAHVDLSMVDIKKDEAVYFNRLFLIMFIFSLGLTILALLFVRSFLTKPIKSLSNVALQYCAPGEERQISFEDVEIKNHDEIADLHQSMVTMEHDLDTYINNLVETRTELNVTRDVANRMELLATRDALTGMLNTRAYDQEVEKLAEGIASGDTKFGFALIDLNDLKVTNDTYGHERGNASLIALSQLISTNFAQSPSFRIGGDEFAVILKDTDYDHAQDRVDAFNNKIAAIHQRVDLEPWKRISAAIGYALFDPARDHDADSVFERADANMYDRKKLMKHGATIR